MLLFATGLLQLWEFKKYCKTFASGEMIHLNCVCVCVRMCVLQQRYSGDVL